MCAQYNASEFRYFQNFKTYDDQLYALEFPEEWITTHKKGTGPAECYNCLDHASWRGVCIGYCPNCASMYRGYSRGPGFYSKAVEYRRPESECPSANSAYNTYLCDVSLEDIGEYDFNMLHTVDAHNEWYDTMEKVYCEGDGDNQDSNATPSCFDDYDDDGSSNVNPVNHVIFEEYSLLEELKTNKDIKVGDTILHTGYNQMSWMKYIVVNHCGQKDVRFLDSYYMQELTSQMPYGNDSYFDIKEIS